MRPALLALVVTGGLTLLAHPAAAGDPGAPGGTEDATDGAPDDPGGSGEPGAEPRLITRPGSRPPEAPRPAGSHEKQVQISVRVPVGLRAIVPYDDDIYCGSTDSGSAMTPSRVCTGRAPFSLDFELAYGVHRRIDALVELRVGIEQDFGSSPNRDDGPRALHFAPGLRFFFGEGGRSRLFTTAQLVIDLASYKDAGGTGQGTDAGLRNLSGIWFDLDRSYGIYAFVGETATFSRWMRFELEAGIGIQARYP
ncbi:MAG: hypothetical protein ACTHU0_35190 [Kofleriaceae bacterium]